MSDVVAVASDAASDAHGALSVMRAAPSAAPVYGDAYVTHFTLVLRTIARERPDFRRLYSPRELTLAEHFLDRLSPLEQHVYARLFQRKGPWFKVSSLLSYFTRKPWEPAKGGANDSEPSAKEVTEADDQDAVEDEPTADMDEAISKEAVSVLGDLPEVADHRQVQTTIQTLVNAGLLLTPTLVSPVFLSKEDQDAQLLLALEAIQQSATSAELTALWKKLSGGKAKASPGPNGRNASPSRSRKTTDSTNDASNGSSTTPGKGTSKGEVFDAVKRLVMTQRRVDGSRIPVAKMMHSIWLESYPLLQHRNLKDDIILVVRISDAAREVFSRMHRLFYFQAAMPTSSSPSSMPASARVKSFQQIVKEKSGTSRSGLDALTYAGSGTLAQQWPGLLVIFKKVQYPSYEIIIRQPIFQSAETYICYEIASRLHRLVNGLEMEMALEQVSKDEDILPNEWIMSDDVFEHLPELTAFQRLLLPPAESAVPDEWQGRACAQFENALLQWKSLDELVLEARKCLRAYNQYHISASSAEEEKDRPVFFDKCNAGYHLARVLHHASTLYEKRRQYSRAIALLRDLLASPVFLVRKRAYWYERLALNYEHLKQHREAKTVCEQALTDTHVLGAGVLAIQRRHERLLRRKDLIVEASSTHVQVSTTNMKRKCDHDADDFVDLVSSSDDEVKNAVSQSVQVTKQVGVDTHVDDEAASSAVEAHNYPQNYIVGRPLNKSTGEKSRFIGYDDEPCDVEQLVLQYYHTQVDGLHSDRAGWYGVHCEGRVLVNLFGLFMWDVIFAPVPDVFQSPYQAAPLDFGFAKVFYDARRERIEQLLDDIEHNLAMQDLLAMLRANWDAHEGQISRFVSWSDTLTLQFHQVVVAAMGQRSLAMLLRHMASSEEFHRAQNGLPDLLLVRVLRKTEQPSENLKCRMHPSNPQALDVYKLSGMSYSMNLNANAKNEASIDDQSESSGEHNSGPNDQELLEQLISNEGSWNLDLKLVEVKGPRDRLSDQQVRWLQLFNDEMGIDASVMHVVEEEKDIEKRQERAKGLKKGTQSKSKKARTGDTKSNPVSGP